MIISHAHASSFHSPMIELKRLFPVDAAKVYLQTTFSGPTGSVKDRTVYFMLNSARNLGLVSPQKGIVEASNGAEGLALASAAAAAGIPLTLFAPEGSYVGRIETLQAFGTRLEFTSKAQGTSGAIRAAEKEATISGAWFPRLFENPANPGAHETTTGPEIWNALHGRLDFFVSGVGSGGTFMGVSRYLRRRDDGIELIAVEPRESAVLSGSKPGSHGIVGLGPGFVPKLFDLTLPTRVETVSTEEAAEWAQKAARTEGLAVGLSTGANLAAVARIVSRRENRDKVIVTVAFSSQMTER